MVHSFTFSFLSREQPIFTCKAHVFHIDPKTKRSWIPASSSAINVSFFYDSTRTLYRIISVEGTKVNKEFSFFFMLNFRPSNAFGLRAPPLSAGTLLRFSCAPTSFFHFLRYMSPASDNDSGNKGITSSLLELYRSRSAPGTRCPHAKNIGRWRWTCVNKFLLSLIELRKADETATKGAIQSERLIACWRATGEHTLGCCSVFWRVQPPAPVKLAKFLATIETLTGVIGTIDVSGGDRGDY